MEKINAFTSNCTKKTASTLRPSWKASTRLNMSRQQLSVVIGQLTGHLGRNGHLYKIGKDINPLCIRCLYGNETVEHLIVCECECESLILSWGRIFLKSFGELQQLSDVPVDLFRRFATEIGLAEKKNRS